MVEVGKYYTFTGEDDIEAYVLFANKSLVIYLDNSDQGNYLSHDDLSTFEFYFEEIFEERNWGPQVHHLNEE